MTGNTEGTKLRPRSPGSSVLNPPLCPGGWSVHRDPALPALPLGFGSTERPLWAPSKCSCPR